jgi:glycosyltransferase involved in cell wall biosynthesis
VSAQRRILHLHDDMRLGGSQRVAVGVANHQARAGTSVAVAAGPQGELWQSLAPDVRPLRSPPHGRVPDKIGFVRWLRRTVRAERIDVVHAHQRQVALLARVAVLGTGAVVVEHVHSTFAPSARTRLLSFRSHHLVACGSSVARMLAEDFGRPRSRISVVRNSVDDLGRDGGLALPSAAGAPPRVLGIGRLDEPKDPQRFVDVVRHLHRSGVPVTAEWIGDGPLRPAIEDDLRRRPVPGLVLSGTRDDVERRIRDADLLLLTSRHEGLPLVVLEAMSLGRAVVCSDVGSCRDVVEDGVNGAVYPPAAGAAEIAAIIAAAVADRRLEQWGRRGRELFAASDGIAGMVRDLSSIYERALDGRRRTGASAPARPQPAVVRR